MSTKRCTCLSSDYFHSGVDTACPLHGTKARALEDIARHEEILKLIDRIEKRTPAEGPWARDARKLVKLIKKRHSTDYGNTKYARQDLDKRRYYYV